MKNILMIIILLLITGCASTGDNQQNKIARITPEELAQLLPAPIATVTLDQIVSDSKQGKSPEEIITKIKESDSRYDLSSSQVLDLSQQGVHISVLDYIQQSNNLAKQNAIANEMNSREKEKVELQKQLQRERLRSNAFLNPFWGPRHHFFFGQPIGPAGRHWRGSRFGWGLPFGHPFGWGW